jgi:hypothetical protein
VVDINCLQNDELRSYLASSRRNRAVLTDYAAMEAYKGDTLRSIFSSMAIVAEYPKQVIVLESTQLACGLTGRVWRFYGRDAALRAYLIDKDQTWGFPQYCVDLMAAKRGNIELQRDIVEHGREATAQMDRILRDMPTLSSGLEMMVEFVRRSHAPAELKILRERGVYTQNMMAKVTQI